MSDSRLSNLALIAVERELSEKLTHDPAEVIDAFVTSGSGRSGKRRLELLLWWHEYFRLLSEGFYVLRRHQEVLSRFPVYFFVESDDHFDLLDERAGQFPMYDFELTEDLILRK